MVVQEGATNVPTGDKRFVLDLGRCLSSVGFGQLSSGIRLILNNKAVKNTASEGLLTSTSAASSCTKSQQQESTVNRDRGLLDWHFFLPVSRQLARQIEPRTIELATNRRC